MPSLSILAEPPVAVVDKVAIRRGTTAEARAYLEYLYSKEGQEIVAKHYYRPRDPEVAAKYASDVPEDQPGDHRRLRRLGEGAGHALRRRRHVRQDLRPLTGRDRHASAATHGRVAAGSTAASRYHVSMLETCA